MEGTLGLRFDTDYAAKQIAGVRRTSTTATKWHALQSCFFYLFAQFQQLVFCFWSNSLTYPNYPYNLIYICICICIYIPAKTYMYMYLSILPIPIIPKKPGAFPHLSQIQSRRKNGPTWSKAPTSPRSSRSPPPTSTASWSSHDSCGFLTKWFMDKRHSCRDKKPIATSLYIIYIY